MKNSNTDILLRTKPNTITKAQNPSHKNINIQIPTSILNKIKILAIQQDLYLKDYIINLLQKEIDNAERR
ncbi:MAG: hypothetical protein ACOYU5_12590 [Stygiobacter sp.]